MNHVYKKIREDLNSILAYSPGEDYLLNKVLKEAKVLVLQRVLENNLAHKIVTFLAGVNPIYVTYLSDNGIMHFKFNNAESIGDYDVRLSNEVEGLTMKLSEDSQVEFGDSVIFIAGKDFSYLVSKEKIR